MPDLPELALAEWLALAVIVERPRHGFAIAALTRPDGELGRIWQVPRPVVYRSLNRLAEAGLIDAAAVESGPGPQRTRYAATAAGRRAVRSWLATPVPHVRDIRSHLLLKLALLDRSGADPGELIRRQRDVLESIADALADRRPPAEGFEGTLLAWRRASARATLAFLDEIGGSAAVRGSRRSRS